MPLPPINAEKAPVLDPESKTKPKLDKPRLYKVILVNDDFTPRGFVTRVLKSVFRLTEDQAHRKMITAHRMGSCVIVVMQRDAAESKAKEATDLGQREGYPLMFTTEPEE